MTPLALPDTHSPLTQASPYALDCSESEAKFEPRQQDLQQVAGNSMGLCCDPADKEGPLLRLSCIMINASSVYLLHEAATIKSVVWRHARQVHGSQIHRLCLLFEQMCRRLEIRDALYQAWTLESEHGTPIRTSDR